MAQAGATSSYVTVEPPIEEMNTLDAARDYVFQQKISVVPIIDGTKRPARKWNVYRERFPTLSELENWFGENNFDVAAVCGRLSNLTVLDADKPAAETWIAQNAITGQILRSPSKGLHYHFEFTDYPNRQNVLDCGIDIRSEGALAMLPPTDGYRWIALGERGQLHNVLPPIINPKRQTFESTSLGEDELTRRTVAYLKKLPVSISGQAGHRRAYRAACCIADRLSHVMPPEQALPIMELWNQNCEPPWSRSELLHKLRSAWQR